MALMPEFGMRRLAAAFQLEARRNLHAITLRPGAFCRAEEPKPIRNAFATTSGSIRPLVAELILRPSPSSNSRRINTYNLTENRHLHSIRINTFKNRQRGRLPCRYSLRCIR